MVLGLKRPFTRVFSVALNHGKVCCNVKAPGRGPTVEFRLQFGPLLLHSTSVFSLMMKQEGRGLNQPLNQQNLFRCC